MALILHELATNAAKYGALKVDGGHIDIKWQAQDGKLTLKWVESGGPPIVAAPVYRGFGSSLTQTMEEQYSGSLDYDWQLPGLAVEIVLPVESLVA